jgi:hypothetical protein
MYILHNKGRIDELPLVVVLCEGALAAQSNIYVSIVETSRNIFNWRVRDTISSLLIKVIIHVSVVERRIIQFCPLSLAASSLQRTSALSGVFLLSNPLEIRLTKINEAFNGSHVCDLLRIVS